MKKRIFILLIGPLLVSCNGGQKKPVGEQAAPPLVEDYPRHWRVPAVIIRPDADYSRSLDNQRGLTAI